MVALSLTFVTACANGGSTDGFPITPVQLLWVNLIMDSFAALALATEPPSESLMDVAPQGKSERLITGVMYKNMLGHAVFQTALLLWLDMTPEGWRFSGATAPMGSVQHHTIVFTTFVALQVFNLFNCRATRDEWNVLEGFSASVIGQVIVCTIVVMQFLIVQFGGAITQTEPLSAQQWRTCIALGALSVPVGYLLKLFPLVDSELRKLAPPHLALPRGALYAEPSAVRGALHRAMERAVEADASGTAAPLPGGPRSAPTPAAQAHRRRAGTDAAAEGGGRPAARAEPAPAEEEPPSSSGGSSAASAGKPRARPAAGRAAAAVSMNALAAATSTSDAHAHTAVSRHGLAAAAVASSSAARAAGVAGSSEEPSRYPSPPNVGDGEGAFAGEPAPQSGLSAARRRPARA